MAEKPLQVVIVSGLSGSGKSTAIHQLEDVGFYCIDNLPVILIPNFLELCQGLREGIRRVALGIDVRDRTFFRRLPEVLADVRAQGHQLEVLFLEASDEVLLRRFSETRRPHPLAAGGMAVDGIRREREEARALREHADRILDTSTLNVHDLRAELAAAYGEPSADDAGCRISVVSFGFKYGVPLDVDMVLDVRFLPNPFFVSDLRPLSGTDDAVAEFLRARPETLEFLRMARDLLRFLVPLYQREQKSYLTVGVGCTGGRHRSVFVVEALAAALREDGRRAQVRHRDLER